MISDALLPLGAGAGGLPVCVRAGVAGFGAGCGGVRGADARAAAGGMVAAGSPSWVGSTTAPRSRVSLGAVEHAGAPAVRSGIRISRYGPIVTGTFDRQRLPRT